MPFDSSFRQSVSEEARKLNVVANVVTVDPRTDSLWAKLVEEVRSSVFHSPQWMQVISSTYGWEPSAHIALDEQVQPLARVPFCRISDMLGERIVMLPFSDYCDPLVNDHELWHVLIDPLVSEHMRSEEHTSELQSHSELVCRLLLEKK